ncbi:hypothetical protein [Francisella sp. TX07-6608]|uniref:hypothetical protein n=1 Tax=Francisella sp. TX07-6608 TaxID=573568 RepID=UPI0008F9D5C3|nr:hypothetical protein [Francisella sp. TX07-6608]OIN82894.1 hypothetical protein KX00_2033 [Francisella sp. TX07-6608]OIN85097.1 hypothetical protein KX00_2188 [Francisella sp. TX07-6608]
MKNLKLGKNVRDLALVKRIDVDHDLHTTLKAYAVCQKVPMYQLAAAAIKEYLSQRNVALIK